MCFNQIETALQCHHNDCWKQLLTFNHKNDVLENLWKNFKYWGSHSQNKFIPAFASYVIVVRLYDIDEIAFFFMCVPQLARIQTDSVADTLKELYPDVHLEIGEEVLHAIICINSIYINCIVFVVSFNQMHRFVRVFYTHAHTLSLYFSCSCPHALTTCLRTESDCVLLRMCNLYDRFTAESYCLCQKTWMMMSESEPVHNCSALNLFVCVHFSCHVDNRGQNPGHCIIKGRIPSSIKCAIMSGFVVSV